MMEGYEDATINQQLLHMTLWRKVKNMLLRKKNLWKNLKKLADTRHDATAINPNSNYAIVSTRRFQYMKTGEFATYFLL